MNEDNFDESTGKDQGEDSEEMSFEKALQELEKVVDSLESGKLSLDESVSYFQKGISLTRLCSKKLDEAERKINILIQNEEGEITQEPYELEEDN